MNNVIFNTDLITSKTNSTIVKIGKLMNKKSRNEDHLFVCNGIKLFEEAVNCKVEIPYIVLNNNSEFSDNIILKLKSCIKNHTKIICVTEQVFEKLSDEKSPQGIVAVCKFLNNITTRFTFVENEKVMMLESVRDPGNVGTIIRNAAAFGIDSLVISSDCADVYSSKVVRAAMGAIFKVKICIVDNLSEVILYFKSNNRRVMTAALTKKSRILTKNSLTPTDIIIIGNEGHGASNEVISLCDETILIPMAENTESLNAAIAAAIFMWELNK
ncbi:MAG: RNA methyltransferase [Clostridia bacterium]|nr:RNA methyltransferase [Clostridia bacterium]